MIDPVATQRFLHGALFLALAALFLFLRLLPLTTFPTRWPGPDLLLCLTFAWLLRRPDFLPVLLVVPVFLLEDLLYLRPPGLWTALVLLATEFLRDRAPGLRSQPLVIEWAMVAVVIALMTAANRLVLALALVPQAGLKLTVLQAVATIAAYPLVVGASHLLFGVNRAAAAEPTILGRRL